MKIINLTFAAIFVTACNQDVSPVNRSGATSETVASTTPSARTKVPDLVGQWHLHILDGYVGDLPITLTLRSDGSIAGETPCNRYFGKYQAGKDLAFSFTEVTATKRACRQQKLESTYFAMMDDVVEYRQSIYKNDIRLLNPAGKAVLVFVNK